MAHASATVRKLALKRVARLNRANKYRARAAAKSAGPKKA